MLYKSLVRPLLFNLNPERIHDVSRFFLKHFGKSGMGRSLMSSLFSYGHEILESEVAGVEFPNPVGLAAGFDKHCELIEVTPCLGFGYTEVGSITAKPQEGNPKPRMFRLQEDKALINRMGFNNRGADYAAEALERVDKRVPVGVNIGLSRETDFSDAVEDYLYTFDKLEEFVDYGVINVSSPNTPGLRSLQSKSWLVKLLDRLDSDVPVFIKLSPDLSLSAVDEVVEVAEAMAEGLVAVNTTLSREGLSSIVGEEGGLSGRPLTMVARNRVSYISQQTDLPIIGVGGVFNAMDAYELIKCGASLVQAYTGFVYEGPAFAKRINEGLAELLEQDGFSSVEEAVSIS